MGWGLTYKRVVALLVLLQVSFAGAASPKQCRVVNKRAAQHPFLPSSTTSTSRPTRTITAGLSSTASHATATSTHATSSPTARPTPFDYSRDKIRGVNLGGWLRRCAVFAWERVAYL